MSYGRGRKRGDIVRASEILLSSSLGVANGIATLGSDGKVPAGQLPSLDYVPNSQKGIANGIATLGSDGKVPSGQLPSLDYIPNSLKGAVNGVATLGSDGKVPSGQLPSLNYVPLTGGTMTGRLFAQLQAATADSQLYSNAQIQVNTGATTGNAAIGFHRPGSTATALYHDGDMTNQLKVIGSNGVSGVVWTGINFNPATKADLAAANPTGKWDFNVNAGSRLIAPVGVDRWAT